MHSSRPTPYDMSCCAMAQCECMPSSDVFYVVWALHICYMHVVWALPLFVSCHAMHSSRPSYGPFLCSYHVMSEMEHAIPHACMHAGLPRALHFLFPALCEPSACGMACSTVGWWHSAWHGTVHGMFIRWMVAHFICREPRQHSLSCTNEV